MSQPVTVTSHGDIAVVTVSNPPVNATSQAVRAGIVSAVNETEADPAVKAVVLMCAGRTFIAGADIREFGKPPLAPSLPDVVKAIEAATKPWVAAIHGVALGGGLEVALGCHYRIAEETAQMGLPEVNLGLIPGAGGTVRLPRAVPMARAIEMITTGRPISAQTAVEAGLIAHVFAGDVLENALGFAETIAAAPLPQPLVDRPVVDPLPENQLTAEREEVLRKARGQMSPVVAFDTVVFAASTNSTDGLANERANFLELQASDQSRALRHIFLAERASAKLDSLKGVEPRDIAKVGVIGGGTMGAGIASICLLSGLPVTLTEQTEDAANAARDRVIGVLQGALKRGKLSEAGFSEATANLVTASDYAALADTDLVIEAVFEDMAVKKDVFAAMQKVVPDSTILATNTSYLDVNEIAATLADPTRMLGLHFFSPAHVMKLLEIVNADQTAPDVLATGLKLAKRLSKIAVVTGVCDGFIGNRIMSAYRREADYLIEDGASPTQVDAAMRDFGFPMGVFEMQDLAGLDIAWAMRKRRAATRDPNERYVRIADKLCEMERFGRKTKAGWYQYPEGKPEPDPVVDDIIRAERENRGIKPQNFTPQRIMDRILNAMQTEAQGVLDDGIARSPDDIDVVMVNGYSFPRWRGGPMFMMSQSSR